MNWSCAISTDNFSNTTPPEQHFYYGQCRRGFKKSNRVRKLQFFDIHSEFPKDVQISNSAQNFKISPAKCGFFALNLAIWMKIFGQEDFPTIL